MIIEEFSQFKHKNIISKLIHYDFSLLSIILVGWLSIDRCNQSLYFKIFIL